MRAFGGGQAGWSNTAPRTDGVCGTEKGGSALVVVLIHIGQAGVHAAAMRLASMGAGRQCTGVVQVVDQFSVECREVLFHDVPLFLVETLLPTARHYVTSYVIVFIFHDNRKNRATCK